MESRVGSSQKVHLHRPCRQPQALSIVSLTVWKSVRDPNFEDVQMYQLTNT